MTVHRHQRPCTGHDARAVQNALALAAATPSQAVTFTYNDRAAFLQATGAIDATDAAAVRVVARTRPRDQANLVGVAASQASERPPGTQCERTFGACPVAQSARGWNSAGSSWMTCAVRSKCARSRATASSARPLMAASISCWCSPLTPRLAKARGAARRR